MDVDLEAEDICEHLVRLVQDSEQWDIPREIIHSLVELDAQAAAARIGSCWSFGPPVT